MDKIRMIGISTPVGGVNWEYKDDDFSSAVIEIAVLLESKRLLTMPWSRVYCHLPFELDVAYCVQSALNLKGRIQFVLNSHKVLPSVLLAINQIVHALNDFLDGVACIQNSPVVKQSNQQQRFQSMIKKLKEEVAKTMGSLLKEVSWNPPFSGEWRILKA